MDTDRLSFVGLRSLFSVALWLLHLIWSACLVCSWPQTLLSHSRCGLWLVSHLLYQEIRTQSTMISVTLILLAPYSTTSWRIWTEIGLIVSSRDSWISRVYPDVWAWFLVLSFSNVLISSAELLHSYQLLAKVDQDRQWGHHNLLHSNPAQDENLFLSCLFSLFHGQSICFLFQQFTCHRIFR